jgi:hypothetical protein
LPAHESRQSHCLDPAIRLVYGGGGGGAARLEDQQLGLFDRRRRGDL